ncbi:MULTISPECIES: hypothetical protein [unclassified Thioalkalivibrio]|uniref:hypothetical protein n=1 Tax=unclassified Thioalkalivibrio TaxID=2621013 RepID=UPI00037B5C32|nr:MULTISPECIES: hypothetical protein [unclassified Thioalkalivibrio]
MTDASDRGPSREAVFEALIEILVPGGRFSFDFHGSGDSGDVTELSVTLPKTFPEGSQIGLAAEVLLDLNHEPSVSPGRVCELNESASGVLSGFANELISRQFPGSEMDAGSQGSCQVLLETCAEMGVDPETMATAAPPIAGKSLFVDSEIVYNRSEPPPDLNIEFEVKPSNDQLLSLFRSARRACGSDRLDLGEEILGVITGDARGDTFPEARFAVALHEEIRGYDARVSPHLGSNSIGAELKEAEELGASPGDAIDLWVEENRGAESLRVGLSIIGSHRPMAWTTTESEPEKRTTSIEENLFKPAGLEILSKMAAKVQARIRAVEMSKAATPSPPSPGRPQRPRM